ncbi:MAG TPA: YIP1 family protein [Candidatus Sulfotelmatobacter sp.]|nr:YIP1 family protein [Candidatus Sulfotelmatobacter sp.]
MAATPLPPTSAPASVPAIEPLSQGARIIDTYIAPSKTFADLRRSASWWAPFLLTVIVSTLFVFVVGQKIGFRKVAENQLQMSPKQAAQLDNLGPDEREQQMQKRATVTKFISYIVPVFILFIWLIISAVLFGTFKFAAGADVSFKVAFAIVVYAGLPNLLKSALAMLSVAAGMSPDSFSFQNPIATNPGYFMNPAGNVFLYSVASGLDIFMIWTLVLTAIGFTCVSKVKSGTAYAIVFGWWAVFTLAGAAIGAAFS